MDNKIAIEEARIMSAEVFEVFQYLTPQLSSSSSAPSYEELAEIISSKSTHLFFARDQSTRRIIGSLTLVVFRIPTGVRAWIEDVVIDSNNRRGGIGRQLCLAAIEKARTLKAKTVDLTSRPAREAANSLYISVGFQKRDTNVYRFTLSRNQ
jgi:ribosomal protein S18 acetylase RimI-like enzyme